MKSGLVNYIVENIKYENKYFYYRDKFRTWSWNFYKVYQYALRFSILLHSRNIGRGDMILLKGSNRPEWVCVFIGCLLKGVVVVPLDVKSDIDFDLRVRDKVKPKLAVWSRELSVEGEGLGIPVIYLEDLENHLPPLDSLPSLCFSGEKGNGISDIEGGDISYPSGYTNVTGIGCEVEPGDLAEIVFTSGTTSVPKGVMITHSNIEANLKAIKPVMDKWKFMFRLMRNLKILSLVPLSHMYGQLIGIFVPLMIGSSIVFINDLTPRAILKAIKEEKIWIVGLLPKFMEILKDYIVNKVVPDSEYFLEKIQKFKNRKWYYRFWAFRDIHIKLGWRFCAIIVGGAALSSQADEFWRCLAYAIFQGYGLTETAPLVTLADPSEAKPGSIGRVLAGQEVRILDNEIWVRGPNVSPGYFGDPSKSMEVFQDGWFKTGDLAEIDENGNIYFKGRKDDVIIRSDGVNIYPEDIENVVKAESRESVKDCVVIGLRENGYEKIHVVLLLGDEPKETPEEIIEKANRKLASYQRIDGYTIWPGEDFPRTSTLKVKKSEIFKFLQEVGRKQKTEISLMEQSGFQGELLELIKSFHGLETRDIKEDAKLEKDLGLDSLDLIQLSLAIESKYNIEADNLPITRDTTIREIENLIKNPPKESFRLPFYTFPYWNTVNVIRTIVQFILYPFIRCIYRVKVYGEDNLKDITTPVVFASNHVGPFDSLAILYALPLRVRRRLTVLMSIEHHFQHFFYHKGPLVRRGIEAIGFYLLANLAMAICPLSRHYGFKQTMKNIGMLLDKGWHVLIFPEGGVTPDGRMRRFESGIGVIVSDMKVPVVPVRIDGLFDILHNGILPLGHRPKWPLVRVSFGKPLKMDTADYKKIAETVEEAVRSL